MKTKNTVKKFLFFTFVFSLISGSLYSQSRGFVQKRLEKKDHVALIIGNSAYPDAPLTNPVNDAEDVARVFSEMGFIVEKVLNADKEQMARAINSFKQKLQTANAAVFYFAGHGMQIDGENYLIPIGNTAATQITEESQVPYRAVNAGEILASMEQAKINFSLIVLDACRNNPIKGSGRGRVPGLASINAPAGSLVMYATQAGKTADDGIGTRNSPFTTAFIQHIKTPGLDVNLLPSMVTKTVSETTGGKQMPGSYIQLTQSFTFVPAYTPEELKAIKEGKLGELEKIRVQDAEAALRKAEEDAAMAKRQAEINALDKQIAELKTKTVQGSSTGDLDALILIVEEREKQQQELEALRKKAEAEQLAREKEIALLKEKERQAKSLKLNEDLQKYYRISRSEFGKDLKANAWNGILAAWGLAEGSIAIDDACALKKALGILKDCFADSRDGKTYGTVKIGNQIWMAENLNYITSSGSWCYDNNTSNCDKYGRLYDWETAKKVCPSGWHLPSDAEWSTLSNFVGSDSGKKLKSTSGWNSSGNGTDAYGFTALPGGYRYYSGNFSYIGDNGYWWSSTESGTTYAYSRGMGYNRSDVTRYDHNKPNGFSVRCVRDF